MVFFGSAPSQVQILQTVANIGEMLSKSGSTSQKN